LKFNTQHFFKAHFDVGVGTNTKEKLLGLWGLLSIANGCHIEDLMVVGDSRVVIDWMDGKSQLEALNLRSWKVNIQELKLQFRWMKGLHVHRQFNSMKTPFKNKHWRRSLGGSISRRSTRIL
jgi:hypothetical protein